MAPLYNLKYIELYRECEDLMERHNPCGKCEKAGCCGSYTTDSGKKIGACEHLDNNGCTIKNILCKLWVCKKTWDKLSSTFFDEQKRLLDIGRKKNWLVHRGEPWGLMKGWATVKFKWGSFLFYKGGFVR